MRALNLEVEAGEFLTLLGPSGSGKTTTLTMLAGFEQPSRGRIFVAGEDVTAVPVEKRGIGMVFQNYALFPNMSVGENIGFPLKVRRLPRAEIAQKVARALSMVRLEGLADRRTQQLSGGQQQRVAVARALVFEPRLVLLDEPLGALDRQLREQMQYELKHLHQRLGVTMVYVTHDQVEAMTMSDRVAVFSTGQLRQVAEPRRLYEEPDSLFVAQFLGESNALRRHGRSAATAGSAAATLARRRDDRRHGGRRLRRGRQGRSRDAAGEGGAGRGGTRAAPIASRRACVEATFLGDQLRVRLAALGREDFVREAAPTRRDRARSNRAPRSRSAGGRRIAVPSSRERRPRAQAAYWLILLPAVLMLVALYLVPLADVLLTSVTDPKPGLDNYALLFTSASVQKDAADDAAHRRHHDAAGAAAGLCRGLRHARGDLAAAAHHAVLRAAAVLDLGAGALLRLARPCSARQGVLNRPADRLAA